MIDLKLLRSEPERFREAMRRRGADVDVDALVSLDSRYRELLQEVERGRARQNEANTRVSSASGDEKEKAIAEARKLSESVKQAEADLQQAQEELDSLLEGVPNLVHPEVPDGYEDEDNAVLREVGERRPFDFEAKDHLDLGELLDIIDVVRAAKVSGSRFGYLKGAGAMLELALVRFTMERLAAEGFTPVVPPVLVRREAMYGTGFFPTDEQQVYRIEADDLYLAGTAEVPLAGLHSEEILSVEGLPVRYVGFSSSFRREAGTYGKDTRGIIRVHQFDKVEMFSYCRPDESEAEHEHILSHQEQIFSALEIPYRVVDVCAGQLGAPYSRKFDLEAWLPGAQRWLEVTSCSNALDYQARRLQIRARGDDGNFFVHTLNGTAVAIGRAIVAILENHQQSDGSVLVPESLRPYTGFEAIEA